MTNANISCAQVFYNKLNDAIDKELINSEKDVIVFLTDNGMAQTAVMLDDPSIEEGYCVWLFKQDNSTLQIGFFNSDQFGFHVDLSHGYLVNDKQVH